MDVTRKASSVPLYPMDRRHFDEYIQQLRAACGKGLGFALIMGFPHPLEDFLMTFGDAIEDKCDESQELQDFCYVFENGTEEANRMLGLEEFPSNMEADENPDFVYEDIFNKQPKTCMQYVRLCTKAGAMTAAEGAPYLEKCKQWVLANGAIFTVVSASLTVGESAHLIAPSKCEFGAGLHALQLIEESGIRTTKQTARAILRQFISFKLLPRETVERGYLRLTKMLKLLKDHKTKAEDLLQTLLEVVFLDGLPDDPFAMVKQLARLDDSLKLDMTWIKNTLIPACEEAGCIQFH